MNGEGGGGFGFKHKSCSWIYPTECQFYSNAFCYSQWKLCIAQSTYGTESYRYIPLVARQIDFGIACLLSP